METLNRECDAIKKSFQKNHWHEVGRLLDEMKLKLTEISFMPLDDTASVKELVFARTILEMGVEYSVAIEDVQSFKSYMMMLKAYYFDFEEMKLPESAKKYEMIGLNLMQLLSKNEAMSFHTELELLDSRIILEDPYVSFAVRLEQDIMAGNYKKAMEVKLPSASYKLFTDILLVTIREEIANGMEVAYDEISVDGCKALLNFESTSAGKSKGELFAKERTDNWRVDSKNMIQFKDTTTTDKPLGKDMDEASKELAKMAIRYAKETEQIV